MYFKSHLFLWLLLLSAKRLCNTNQITLNLVESQININRSEFRLFGTLFPSHPKGKSVPTWVEFTTT